MILGSSYIGNLTTNWYLYFTPSNDNLHGEEVFENFRYYLEAYWLALAIINFVLLIIVIIVFKAAPELIPSKSQ